VNWFTTIPNGLSPCLNDFDHLKRKLTTCYRKFGKWANFLAVDFYSKGSNGGAFKTVQWLNEKLTGTFYLPTTLFPLQLLFYIAIYPTKNRPYHFGCLCSILCFSLDQMRMRVDES
jgi:hypothetical protein